MLLEINPIWISIGPVLIINLILLIHLLTFAATKDRWSMPEDLKDRSNSKFLNKFLKMWWYCLNMPIARFFVKIHLAPNSITFIGFVFSAFSAWLFAIGQFGYAGWVMIFGATFDMFDGKVARLTGKVTRSGAYFDSVMDRFGESVVMLGLAIYFRNSWMLYVIIAALIGSMLVSYTRARGEGVGVICKKGSMQRPERIVYVGVSSIFQPLATVLIASLWPGTTPFLVIAALCFVAFMTNVTAVYRMVYIMNELDEADKRGVDTLPKLFTKLATKEGREDWWLKVRYGYDRAERKFDTCLFILVDGADGKLMEEMRGRGELPNIQKYIVDRGMYGSAVTAFPSTTGPAFTPLVTGCFPGTCNIPGIKWFDRTVAPHKRLTLMRFRDYYGWGSHALDMDLSKDVHTIFECSRKAVNILGMLNRGTGMTRDPSFFRIPQLYAKLKKTDNVEELEEAAFRWFEQAIKKQPDFVFYYYPGVERYIHDAAKERELAVGSYRRLDNYIERIADQLKKEGTFERTLIVLTGDHGHTKAGSHFDLETTLADRYRLLTFPRRFGEWEHAEAINMNSGGAMSNIYVRNGGAWERFSFFEDLKKQGLVGELLEHDAVDVVAGRSSEGGVMVSSRRGSAHIVVDADGRISYRPESGDPFGFGPMPHVMNQREVLERTIDSRYPDAIQQVSQIFGSVRAGDLVVSASEGASLMSGSGSAFLHGSLLSEHMMVPFYSSAKIADGPVRTADIFTTVTALLGIAPAHKMDGVNLALVTEKRPTLTSGSEGLPCY